MSFLALYGIFAVSVGFLACYELMRPAISQIAKDRPNDVLVQNKALAHLVMFCIATLTAPLTVLSIFVPKLQAEVMVQLINDRD